MCWTRGHPVRTVGQFDRAFWTACQANRTLGHGCNTERSLQELRRAHKLTQKKMAEVLGVGQDSVSRLEQRSDLLISTLRGYVEAMGGKLSLVAEFPDQEPVILTGLASLE